MSTASNNLGFPIPIDQNSTGTWGVELIECLVNIDASLLSHNLAEDSDNHSGLSFAYKSGKLMLGSTFTNISASSISLDDDTTNYIELTQAGAVSYNTTGFTNGNMPLFEVVTLSGAISTVTDKRAYMSHNNFNMVFSNESSHDYSGGHSDWSLSASEMQNFRVSVSNADAAVNAIATATNGKMYLIYNDSGYTLTFKASGQTGVSIVNGGRALVISNGTDFVRFALDSSFSVKKNFTITDLSDGNTPPTKTYGNYFKGYAFTIGDDCFFTFKIPEDADINETIYCKVLWYINEAYATNSGEVRFRVHQISIANGESISSGGAISYMSDSDIPATANTLKEDAFSVFSPAAGDLVGVDLERVALSDGNNPSGAEPVIVAIVVEYTSNKLGGSV